MQRSLRLSARLLCRQQCRHRSSSSQAQLSPAHVEPVASSSRSTVKFSEKILAKENDYGGKSSGKRKLALEDLDNKQRHRLEQNNVDHYLASLRVGGIEPTLEDLERLRPKKKPSSNSAKYAEAYNELMDRLCRTFSKIQLREFGEQLGFDGIWTRSKRRKVEYAETILEKAWGWDNLKEIERRKRDMSEVLIKSFSVTPNELFLLLGKDGSELLQISVDYNVHISVTANPLSIRIEGLRGSLKDLEKLLAERRKAIIEETTELPTKAPLSPELVQQVSRLANAYIENLGGKGKIRICANDIRHLNSAKRLAIRASMLVNHESHIPYLVFLPPDPPALSSALYSHTYSLYPFLPHRTSPWVNKAGGTFRCRRVSEWLGEPLGENVLTTAGLASENCRFLTETGDSIAIEQLIQKVFPGSKNVGLAASTGHIIFSEKSRKYQASIIPPLPGHWQFPKFMTWLQEGKAQRWFIPSLPAPLHNTSPLSEKILHRLTYRRLQTNEEEASTTSEFPSPVKVLKYEVVLMEKTTPSESQRAGKDLEQAPNSQLEDELEVALANDQLNSSSSEQEAVISYDGRESAGEAETKLEMTGNDHERTSGNASPNDASNSQSQAILSVIGEPTFQRVLELDVLLSLPDRPLDAMLTVTDTQYDLALKDASVMAYFESIKEFLKDPTKEHPEPPVVLERDGETYVLQSSESIRRSEEKVISKMQKPINWDSTSSLEIDDRVLSTTSESILDLDANQKSVHCKLTYQPSDGELRKFWGDLDNITSISYSAKGKAAATLALQDETFEDHL